MPLEPDDAQHLRSAQQLVDDGKFLEANEELERIDPGCRHVPEVLTVRLDIYQALGKWDGVEVVAHQLVRYDPNDVRATVVWATATRHTDGLAAAIVILGEAVERMPEAAALHYKLAAYEAQLGDLEEAKARLKEATFLEPALSRSALGDPDLRPVWDSLEK